MEKLTVLQSPKNHDNFMLIMILCWPRFEGIFIPLLVVGWVSHMNDKNTKFGVVIFYPIHYHFRMGTIKISYGVTKNHYN